MATTLMNMQRLPLIRVLPLLLLRAPTTRNAQATPLLSTLLLMLALCLRDWLEGGGAGQFSIYALGSALWLPLVMAWYFHMAGEAETAPRTDRSAALGYSLLLELLTLHTLLYASLLTLPWSEGDAGINLLIWGLWIWKLAGIAALFVHWSDRDLLESRRGLAMALLVGIAPQLWLEQQVGRFWYQEEELSWQHLPSPEIVFSQQADLLEGWADTLPAGIPGVQESWSISFGSHGAQDVFREEALYATGIFEQRFGTSGRALTLINHPDTTAQYPLATATNLAHALDIIGQRMNRDEDTLYLYITSHGMENAEVSVQLGNWKMEPVTSDSLRAALDAAGIRWRVLIISACFAGSFIPVLEDEHTLIITAASADRTSFGCSNERHFTYFGEALLAAQLNRGIPLTEAFRNAKRIIREREKEEGLTPSNPQWWAGDAMQARLGDNDGNSLVEDGLAGATLPTPACVSCQMAERYDEDSSTTKATANARSSDKLK